METKSDFFLGLDLSTQKLKGIIINKELEILYLDSVDFEIDLPTYKTQKGVLHLEGGECISPVFMFIEALDILFEKIKSSKMEIGSIKAISGSAQQHGSVFWGKKSEEILNKLDPSKKLLPQFFEEEVFSLEYSPIWMDSTTTKYCKELETSFGQEKLCEITGSRAFERFTGNQIKKIFVEKQNEYNKTMHISLISSFLAEIILGKHTAIDFSDASGMNLFDIRKKKWDPDLLKICGGINLESKLLPPVPSHQCLGLINNYFVKRYGFNESCKVIAFSGDNPCSLVGLGLCEPGIVGISLGTSDTLFSVINENEAKPNLDGHLFVSPFDEKEMMLMICMKNGALVREKYKKIYAKDEWNEFEKIVRGSNISDIIGFFFEYPEICPQINVKNFTYFRRKNGEEISIENMSENEILQVLLVSKAILLKLASEKSGLKNVEKIVVTGGSSKSLGFLEIISNVFNQKIYKVDVNEAAALGAAYKAFHGYVCHNEGKFIEIQKALPLKSLKLQLMASPNEKEVDHFKDLIKYYEKVLNDLIMRFPYNG